MMLVVLGFVRILSGAGRRLRWRSRFVHIYLKMHTKISYVITPLHSRLYNGKYKMYRVNISSGYVLMAYRSEEIFWIFVKKFLTTLGLL